MDWSIDRSSNLLDTCDRLAARKLRVRPELVI
jgi:hypothetical protein